MNNFKIGLCSVTFRKKSAAQVVLIAKKAGVEYIEWGGDIHVTNAEEARIVKSICDNEGIKISSYGSMCNETHRMAYYMLEELERYSSGKETRYEVTKEMLKAMA